MSEFGGRKNPDTSKKTRRAQMRAARIKTRQQAAEELMVAHNALTTLQKLNKLDQRLGVDVGANKERARLKSILEQEKQELIKEIEIMNVSEEKETELPKKKKSHKNKKD